MDPDKDGNSDSDDHEPGDNNVIGVPNNEEAIKTIEHSKYKFNKRDKLKAEMFQRFQHVAGYPLDEIIAYSVNINIIKNSLITRRHVLLAKEMIGPSKHAVQGKTTCSKIYEVDVTPQKIDFPRSMMKF